ncbi:MAG: T9SS type A sorting domain-containing protein [Bacteroides sp.]|nr:T9SS type A sorting domain-containing protein [Bacteroides sp.]
MKAKPIIILCLYLLSLNAWANPEVVPETEPFKLWSLYWENTVIDGNWNGTNQYFVMGDTAIGNNSYKKIFWREDGDKQNEALAGYALREDSVRVYVYDYTGQREHVLFDFSLKANDVLMMDWVEETDNLKNPVFRVLEVGDTIAPFPFGQSHYLKVYDTVHQVMDMWLTGIGSALHGIAWHKSGLPSEIFETLLCIDGWSMHGKGRCYSGDDHYYISGRGKLVIVGTPALIFPEFDCCYQALAVAMDDGVHILSNNMDTVPFSGWAVDGFPFHFQGVDYMEGDSIEVMNGFVEHFYSLKGYPYSEMLVTDIRKVGAAPTEKHPKAELILSPNPTGETITLTTTGCGLQKVEILDVNGRVLYAAILDNQTSFRYNVSWMPSGIYFARVKTPCGVLTEKFSVR